MSGDDYWYIISNIMQFQNIFCAPTYIKKLAVSVFDLVCKKKTCNKLLKLFFGPDCVTLVLG